MLATNISWLVSAPCNKYTETNFYEQLIIIGKNFAKK